MINVHLLVDKSKMIYFDCKGRNNILVRMPLCAIMIEQKTATASL